jgi:hypothetical protein
MTRHDRAVMLVNKRKEVEAPDNPDFGRRIVRDVLLIMFLVVFGIIAMVFFAAEIAMPDRETEEAEMLQNEE